MADCLKSVEMVYAANSDPAVIELEITGTEVAFNLGLSQSPVSHVVSRGKQLVIRQNLQFKKRDLCIYA